MTLSQALTLDLIRQLCPVVAALRLRRPNLADQLERAATSVSLNLGEAGGRSGRDSLRVLRIAAGEAQEVKAALETVRAWGYLDDAALEPARRLADRLGGVLYGLVRKVERG